MLGLTQEEARILRVAVSGVNYDLTWDEVVVCLCLNERGYIVILPDPRNRPGFNMYCASSLCREALSVHDRVKELEHHACPS
jgi:hypothetical protein